MQKELIKIIEQLKQETSLDQNQPPLIALHVNWWRLLFKKGEEDE